MHRKVFLATAMVCCLCASAHAASTISTGGPYVFTEGTVGNIVLVTVTGGDEVEGMNAVLSISTETTAGLPLITAVDLENGTIFDGNNDGQVNTDPLGNANGPGVLAVPGSRYRGSIITDAGTVTATGLLGTFTISTVGVAPGIYPLYLTKNIGVPMSTWNFADVDITVIKDDFSTDETAYIEVVAIPEPASIVLGMFAAAGLGFVVLRRRRARKSA
jgi:hypothetical protein